MIVAFLDKLALSSLSPSSGKLLGAGLALLPVAIGSLRRSMYHASDQNIASFFPHLIRYLREHFPKFAFDLTKTTEENWKVPSFVGDNSETRPLLDYDYHATYGHTRVQVQDDILRQLCNDQNSKSELLPWVVFTAGAMGAGKGYVVRWMDQNGYLPMEEFVVVDPDIIRQMLPEWDAYVNYDSESAGDKTQKEAGHIAEILGYKALRNRYRVIFDGSLRDAKWYMSFFERIRDHFPGIRIMILHILSEKDEVLRRAEKRGEETGRVVPKKTLLASMEAVPQSVHTLAPYCDFCCRVLNKAGQDPQVMREPDAPFPPRSVDIDWNTIKGLWVNPDTDGDGELSRHEIDELLQRGGITEKVVKSLDTDGDGKISKEEFRAAAIAADKNGRDSGRQKQWCGHGVG